MSKLNISLIILFILTIILITLYNERNIEKMEVEHYRQVLLERAAINKFESVSKFLKLFPDTSLLNNSFKPNKNNDSPQYSYLGTTSDLEVTYSCILPSHTLNDGLVTFIGVPIFERTKYIITKQSIGSDKTILVSIDEIENELLLKKK